jgi:hypothetical protein
LALGRTSLPHISTRLTHPAADHFRVDAQNLRDPGAGNAPLPQPLRANSGGIVRATLAARIEVIGFEQL